jgi:hypothetical protein
VVGQTDDMWEVVVEATGEMLLRTQVKKKQRNDRSKCSKMLFGRIWFVPRNSRRSPL